MRFWVGVTDPHWFGFLKEHPFDEVNSWQPNARPPFTNIPAGMLFLFKLKRPHHHIAGGGFLIGYLHLPLSLAWEIFGKKNGAPTHDELEDRICPLNRTSQRDPEIGCTLLAMPFFWNPDDWLENPPRVESSIMRGKMYDCDEPDGRRIFDHLQGRIPAPSTTPDPAAMTETMVQDRYGHPYWSRPRLGQSSFRALVTEGYKRRCAMTGEKTLVTLEAAHIVPYGRNEDSHDVPNGLLLGADFHRLFDAGLISITPNLRIKVSSRIRETWFNGQVYYRLDGQPLSVIPDDKNLRPDPDRLQWHDSNCFQA